MSAPFVLMPRTGISCVSLSKVGRLRRGELRKRLEVQIRYHWTSRDSAGSFALTRLPPTLMFFNTASVWCVGSPSHDSSITLFDEHHDMREESCKKIRLNRRHRQILLTYRIEHAKSITENNQEKPSLYQVNSHSWKYTERKHQQDDKYSTNPTRCTMPQDMALRRSRYGPACNKQERPRLSIMTTVPLGVLVPSADA